MPTSSPLHSTTTSFDPDTPEGWDQLRQLGHRMVDDTMGMLQHLPQAPAWRDMPDETREQFREGPPINGEGYQAVYEQFLNHVRPYPSGNLHPRFFGWVQGNGTPYAMFADMLAAGMNSNLGGFNQAPVLVERQVVTWFAELFGMNGASGILVTGGTMANTLALAAARNTYETSTGRDVRRDGLQSWPGDTPPKPLVFYGSSETHGWAQKAAEWLGLGDRAFRRIPVDGEYRIQLDVLAETIAHDRESGLEPFCIIGTAGTVNTGASDGLDALADIAAREKLWFHVDGAFGALAYLSPSLRSQVNGMQRADSIAFDLHKWGSMPYECACTLIRDPEVHHAAFRTRASYLAPATRGVAAGGYFFSERGLDLSRGFKALKVWMSLKAEGVDKLARIIEQNVAQVQYLAERIGQHRELELMAPVPLNIACFRFVSDMVPSTELDALNAELLVRLQERGIAVPSSTTIDGAFAIRVAHVNHRTTHADIDLMLDAIVAIGRELVEEAGVQLHRTRE